MSAPGLLTLSDVACERGGRLLFSGLDLRLQAGQLLRVEGANGAGKSSLLRLLCGLLAPSAGLLRWRGEAGAAALGREALYLGHEPALKSELSALENLQAACRLSGHTAGHAAGNAAAMASLAAAGLGGFEATPARRLSRGQRQRCALARLPLGRSAPLWVLDEPFNALDSAAVSWLEGLLRGQLLRGGAVVFTSHIERTLSDLPQQVLAL